VAKGRNIGATLSLKAGNFFANMKKAQNESNNLRSTLNNTSKKISELGDKAKVVGSAVGKLGKGLAIAGTAAATAVGTMVAKSVSSFADYEQLTGGVDTLFKDSSAAVQKYANDAYKTAGLSANSYMETVTNFSASLISSLKGDTAKAADYANSALVDMADNANKMGTNMTDIQNAYQGFAKQNYTMLDNLKLGYGGTQAEMKRLLGDAQKLTGQKYDISSFADITQAIHAIQTQMDITGTTAKEASTTISGSWGSLKAAFENTLVSLTTGGKMFDQSLDALVDSAKTFGQNVIPAITGALSGVGYLIDGLAPTIGEVIPPLINDLAPTLANSAASLISSLVNGLVQNASQFSNCLNNIVVVAVTGLSAVVPKLLIATSQIVGNLMQGLSNSMPQIISGAVTLIEGLVDGLVDNVPLLAMGAVQLVTSLANGLIENLPRIIDAGVNLITGIISASYSMMPQIIQNGMQLVVNLAVGLVRAIPQLIAALPRITGAIVKGFKSVNWFDLGLQLIKSIWGGIKSIESEMWNGVKEKTSELWGGVKNVVSEKLNNIKSAYDAHGGGLKGATFAAIEGVKEYYRTGYDAINQLTGGKLGEIINAVGEKMEVVKSKFGEAFGNVKNTVMTIFENIKNGIVEKITAAVDTVKNVFTKISDTVSSVWDKIKSLLKAPKIVQTGTVTVMGVDTPIPKFGLDWNAKGGIMTRPTAFGFANGKIQMGGEAGAEAILPLSAFWRNLQAYTENSQKKSQGNNDININVTINAGNANEEEMAARFINIVVPEIKRQYAIL
jgi:phage-related protein